MDPYNVQEISQGIIKACEMSKDQRIALTNQSQEKRKKFTWDHVAEVVYSSLEEVSVRT